jgi:hypothetical protein
MMGRKQTRTNQMRTYTRQDVCGAHRESFAACALFLGAFFPAESIMTSLVIGGFGGCGFRCVCCSLVLLHGADNGSDLFNRNVTNSALVGPARFPFLVTVFADFITLFKREFIPISW